MAYTIPAQTRIGHVHLKVADLDRSLQFYCGLLGFEIMQRYGDSAVFISAGGYHHHIGLNTWHSKNRQPASVEAAGLYHVAILYPTRRDLAIALNGSGGEMGWTLCMLLMENGLLAKPTHGNKIRFAPPLTINKTQVDECIQIVGSSLHSLG